MPDEPRLEEQALSEAAQMTISTQLDEVENLDVDVRTNLFKMVQGQAESVAIAGQGMVMQKDIRVHELELHTGSIGIDLISALFGEVELNKPVEANARIVLTEPDINRALNSDYIRRKSQSLELNVDGQILTFEPQQMEVLLPGSGKIGFRGTFLVHEIGKTGRVSFTAMIRPGSSNQPLLLEAFNCTEGNGISLELAIAFLNKAKELINLPYFDLEGAAFRIKAVDIQEGNLTLHTEAYISQLPKLDNEA
ncbi:MAG TPA: DUF2993 domain-containing protein [Coleofasciculaceae cyanobacterium]|jgi:hypothetical protein